MSTPNPHHAKFIASLRELSTPLPPPLLDLLTIHMGAPNLSSLLAEYGESSGVPKVVLHGTTGPYLTRYMLHDGSAGRTYLHQFHRPDEDREYHDHPWAFTAYVLVGSYTEARLVERLELVEGRTAPVLAPNLQVRFAGTSYTIGASEWHRIESLCGQSSVWTIVQTGPKEKSWGFFDPNTGRKTPWREFLRMKGLDGAT
jgi:hypothetical protein